MGSNNNDRPIVSVVLPVYNGENHLHCAIQSILAQTMQAFEFIIINDASTDNTEDIIYSFKDDRINYLKNEKNVGITKSLNLALIKTMGKYVARMDADDECYPERLEKQVEFMETHPNVGVCGTWFKQFGLKSEIIKFPVSDEDIRFEMLTRNPISHPSAMIRKKIIDKNQILYDENYPVAQDYKLWYDLLKVSKLANIPEVLLKYRYHSNTITEKNKEIQDKYAFSIRKLLYNDIVEKTIPDYIYSVLEGKYTSKLNIMELNYWLKNLKRTNQENKFYNVKKFNHLLLSKVYSYIFNYHEFSTKDIKFLFSNFFFKFSMTSKLQFIKKCLA